MTSEILKDESPGVNPLSLTGKVLSIPQIIRQEIIQSNGFANSLSSTMDFIRKHRKIKFNTESRLSNGVTVLLELLTFFSIIFYRWMHVHFFKKSDIYLICLWMESLVIIGFAKALFKIFNLPKYTLMKNVSYLYPLLMLNGILVVVNGYDFVYFTRKSGGSEFYQFSMVLYVPILLTVIQGVCTLQFPNYFFNVMFFFTILKVTILFQDPEFSLSFSLCAGSIIYGTIYAAYIICLKTDLQKYTALELIYSLSVMLFFILPVFIIERGELSRGFSVKMLLVSIMTASFKLGSLYFTLFLLKQTDPVRTLVTINAAFVPDHFIQALIYKLDCHISTCKVCLFMVTDFILGHYKRQNRSETRDDGFTLMK